MDKAARRDLAANIYIEKHHIIPRCMGGSDNETNIAKLTAAEHYLAHQLLVKIHPENKNLIYGAHAMTIASNKQHIRNNKEYRWIRERFAKEVSNLHTGKLVSESTKKKMSIAAKNRKSNWLGKRHSEESKKRMSDSKKKTSVGVGNSNAHYWKIQLPDGNINITKCLSEFAKQLNVSIYRLRNNKVDGYKIIDKIRII